MALHDIGLLFSWLSIWHVQQVAGLSWEMVLEYTAEPLRPHTTVVLPV